MWKECEDIALSHLNFIAHLTEERRSDASVCNATHAFGPPSKFQASIVQTVFVRRQAFDVFRVSTRLCGGGATDVTICHVAFDVHRYFE